MVKRWLSTFAEQPSSAALQVVAEDLGERMRCSHDLGRQRGGVLRIGGCGSRTGADADRVQRASISSARAGHSDSMDCLVLLCSAAPPAPCARCAKRRDTDLLTEKSFLLFTRGLQMRKLHCFSFSHLEVPRPCAAECARAVFLPPPQLSHSSL